MSEGDWDMVSMGNQVVEVHGANFCAGEFCCIHKPSPHHMVTWPQVWRNDRKMVERICEHGVGHPDPDDIEYKNMVYGEKSAAAWGVHGCDGCCATPAVSN